MNICQFKPFLGTEEYESIKSCFDNNWVTEGPKSKEFVKCLCNLMNVRYGVLAPNGTLALYLGLRAMGIEIGDEVIVPNFTFIASANAVEMCRAIPIFCDINDDLQININDCERLLTTKTKAIMPVHMYGMSSNMDDVCEFAKKHNLKIIEDSAQAIGIFWRNKHCGTFGDVGCFSFFADKTITTGVLELVQRRGALFAAHERLLSHHPPLAISSKRQSPANNTSTMPSLLTKRTVAILSSL